jgi:hypothetical protein
MQVMVPQSTPTIDGHPANRSMVGINEQFPLRNSMIVLNVMQVGNPQSSLIVDLLQENSRPLDWLKKDHQMTSI